MSQVNLNQNIRFRLTEHGSNYWNQFVEKEAREHNLLPRELSIENDDVVTMQLHEFMHIFGSQLYVGAINVIVNNEFEVLK